MAKRKVVNKVVVDKKILLERVKQTKSCTVAMLTLKHKNTQFSVFLIF